MIEYLFILFMMLIVFIRFRPARTYKDADENGFSCCAFAVSLNQLDLSILYLVNVFSNYQQ